MASSESIPFAVPDIGDEEIDAVTEVMRSGWITTGHECRAFEREFADAVGATFAVALNSCTAALHLSLEAWGVTAGDLVYMSPYTFAATGEVVRYLGATPVFVDIEPTTLNIDVDKLRETVEAQMDGSAGRPKAIVPVHVAGVPCDMEAVWTLAREKELVVVEDAAHAFPAARQGRTVGQVPDDVHGTACFSFYATKTLTTGEGGMVTTEHKEVAERIRTMSLHGLSRQAWNRYAAGGTWKYDIVAPGYKYNLTDVAAAMGRVQLKRSAELLSRRREIATAYNQAFDAVVGLECPTVPDEVDSAWHLYILRLKPELLRVGRDELVDRLGDQGIGTSVHFIPLHLHSFYRHEYMLRAEDFPIALHEYQCALSLPMHSTMTSQDIGRVMDSVLSAVRELDG